MNCAVCSVTEYIHMIIGVLILIPHLFHIFNQVVEETVRLALWLWREMCIIQSKQTVTTTKSEQKQTLLLFNTVAYCIYSSSSETLSSFLRGTYYPRVMNK